MVVKLKNKLRVARAERNISQEESANMVGASRQTILAIENEKFNPSMKLGMLIALALNKSVEDLFYLVEE